MTGVGRCTILVVDDDPHLREALRTLLEDEGYRVEEAADGVEALDVIDRCHVDVVLLDLQMPRLDGAGFIAAASARGALPPVVAMSAGRLSTPGAPVTRFLAKPFAARAMLDALEDAMASGFTVPATPTPT